MCSIAVVVYSCFEKYISVDMSYEVGQGQLEFGKAIDLDPHFNSVHTEKHFLPTSTRVVCKSMKV